MDGAYSDSARLSERIRVRPACQYPGLSIIRERASWNDWTCERLPGSRPAKRQLSLQRGQKRKFFSRPHCRHLFGRYDGLSMRHHRPAIIAIALLVAACSKTSPTAADIAPIEKWTARQGCIGKLARWSRFYYFRDSGLLETPSIIEVQFVQPDYLRVPAGVYFKPPRAAGVIDDNQFRVAGGSYHVASKTMRDWQCGCNLPPYDVSQTTGCTKDS